MKFYGVALGDRSKLGADERTVQRPVLAGFSVFRLVRVRVTNGFFFESGFYSARSNGVQGGHNYLLSQHITLTNAETKHRLLSC